MCWHWIGKSIHIKKEFQGLTGTSLGRRLWMRYKKPLLKNEMRCNLCQYCPFHYWLLLGNRHEQWHFGKIEPELAMHRNDWELYSIPKRGFPHLAFIASVPSNFLKDSNRCRAESWPSQCTDRPVTLNYIDPECYVISGAPHFSVSAYFGLVSYLTERLREWSTKGSDRENASSKRRNSSYGRHIND